MKKVGIFNKISKTLQAMVRNFIEQPGIDELLNQNNFSELYRKFKIFLDGEEVPKPAYAICALTALLLDAGIEVFGKNEDFIYSYSFRGLVMSEYRIPEGVTNIGSEAFAYCNFLEKIYIPSTITYIEENVFLGCDRLTEIHYNGPYKDLRDATASYYGSYNRLFPEETYQDERFFICSDGTYSERGEDI